jgi:Lon protease-like protein
MERVTPIFPLPLVIYPNSYYPLHVFEERYKSLINRSIKNNSTFVIVPTLNDIPANIGTEVSVSQITNKYPTGEFDIVVKGGERVKIVSSWKTSAGYSEAIIEVLEEEDFYADYSVIEILEEKFKSLIKKIDLNLDPNFWKNLELAKMKSYKIAEKCGLSLAQQIKLLTEPDEEERLGFLISHIIELEKTIKERSVMVSLIMNDGYLNN